MRGPQRREIPTNANRPLKIGIQLPTGEEGRTPGSPAAQARWADILRMARFAERVGLDSLWVPDHLLFRRSGSAGPAEGVWEGWSIVAALAAATERIELGALVMCTAFRSPALLARMALTVDAISGGRLILGLGAGWHKPEFDAFGYAFDHRADRFGEAVKTVRALLRADELELAGGSRQARGCLVEPNRNGPPIMVGTTGPRMLQFAARYADIWNAGIVSERSWPDAVPPLRAMVDAACAAAGRQPETLARTVNLLMAFGRDGPRERDGAQPLVGPPDRMASALRGFADEGISHVQVLLRPNTMPSLEKLALVLASLNR